MLKLGQECIFLQLVAFLDRTDLRIDVLVNDAHQSLVFDHLVINEASERYLDVLGQRVYVDLVLGLLEDV